MFDVAIWGTVAAWTGSLLTAASVGAGVAYYVFDRRRERRTQAGSVIVWLHPHEHGPPIIKIENRSGRPVFDHGCLVTSKSTKQVVALRREGWDNSGPFDWPPGDTFEHRDKHTFVNYHDGSEHYLADGESAEYLPDLRYAPAVYDYYAYFRDASGQYWVIDARTHRPVGDRMRRRLDIGPGGIDAS